ncbi:unnamed protein product [Dibothriocephalus latus]|uniref:Uncharacterized protein n=1 Tax=Dibothriocephalus latus TaxID=60516 RepID=A0A3P7LZ27_DIBLA|nr:unnamed protein product [Dibothriocephalus latus]
MQRLVRRYLFKRERERDSEAEKPKESLVLRAEDIQGAEMGMFGGNDPNRIVEFAGGFWASDFVFLTSHRLQQEFLHRQHVQLNNK